MPHQRAWTLDSSPINCTVPDIVNGTADSLVIQYTQTVTYSCSGDLVISDQVKPSCDANGNLTSLPSCDRPVGSHQGNKAASGPIVGGVLGSIAVVLCTVVAVVIARRSGTRISTFAPKVKSQLLTRATIGRCRESIDSDCAPSPAMFDRRDTYLETHIEQDDGGDDGGAKNKYINSNTGFVPSDSGCLQIKEEGIYDLADGSVALSSAILEHSNSGCLQITEEGIYDFAEGSVALSSSQLTHGSATLENLEFNTRGSATLENIELNTRGSATLEHIELNQDYIVPGSNIVYQNQIYDSIVVGNSADV
eukprot:scpid76159/ scgid1077/ 